MPEKYNPCIEFWAVSEEHAIKIANKFVTKLELLADASLEQADGMKRGIYTWEL